MASLQLTWDTRALNAKLLSIKDINWQPYNQKMDIPLSYTHARLILVSSK